MTGRPNDLAAGAASALLGRARETWDAAELQQVGRGGGAGAGADPGGYTHTHTHGAG